MLKRTNSCRAEACGLKRTNSCRAEASMHHGYMLKSQDCVHSGLSTRMISSGRSPRGSSHRHDPNEDERQAAAEGSSHSDARPKGAPRGLSEKRFFPICVESARYHGKYCVLSCIYLVLLRTGDESRECVLCDTLLYQEHPNTAAILGMLSS